MKQKPTLKKLEEYLLEGRSDMSRLALEEEMVRRELIPYSPMHEKLDAIKEKYFETRKKKDQK